MVDTTNRDRCYRCNLYFYTTNKFDCQWNYCCNNSLEFKRGYYEYEYESGKIFGSDEFCWYYQIKLAMPPIGIINTEQLAATSDVYSKDAA